jgi:PTS system mannose-specific IIB component
MLWVRIDNRLIHGQIIETWLPYTGAVLLIIANDELATDALRQEIMSLAIPNDVKVIFTKIDAVTDLVARFSNGDRSNALVLFSSCPDARRAYEQGFAFEGLNIGNLHYSPGKRQICAHVALGDEDQSCIEFFSHKGVKLDFRCVPNDSVQVRIFS